MTDTVAPVVCFIMAIFIVQAGCGQENKITPIETSRLLSPQPMTKLDSEASETLPASDSLALAAPYTLPQALANTTAYAKQRLAVRVDASGTHYGFCA